ATWNDTSSMQRTRTRRSPKLSAQRIGSSSPSGRRAAQGPPSAESPKVGTVPSRRRLRLGSDPKTGPCWTWILHLDGDGFGTQVVSLQLCPDFRHSSVTPASSFGVRPYDRSPLDRDSVSTP